MKFFFNRSDFSLSQNPSSNPGRGTCRSLWPPFFVKKIAKHPLSSPNEEIAKRPLTSRQKNSEASIVLPDKKTALASFDSPLSKGGEGGIDKGDKRGIVRGVRGGSQGEKGLGDEGEKLGCSQTQRHRSIAPGTSCCAPASLISAKIWLYALLLSPLLFGSAVRAQTPSEETEQLNSQNIESVNIPHLQEIDFPETRAELLLPDAPSAEATANVPNPLAQNESPEETEEEETEESETDPGEIFIDPEADLIFTITGTRTLRPLRQSPATITVIEFDEIETNLVQDLDDLIRYEPGVSTSGDPRRYGFQDFNIRGIDGNRVLIQVDGVRLPESFDFGSTRLGRDYVDPEILKRVEIIRGPASTLYGSDSIGGVVSFFTKDPADFLEAEGDDGFFSAKLAYDGVDRSFAETVTASGRLGQIEGLLIYTRRDGYEAQINSDRAPNPQTSATNSWLAKLVYNANEFHTLKLTGEFLYRELDTNVLSSRGVSAFGVRTDSLFSSDEVKRDRYTFSYEFNNPDSTNFFQILRTQIYYQDARSTEQSTEIRRGTPPFATGVANRLRFRDSLFQNNTFGGDLQLESNFKTGDLTHRLVYGFEISNTRTSRLRDGYQETIGFPGRIGSRTNRVGPDAFPVKDIADTDNFRFGIYLQDEITWGNLTLIPGIRYDAYRLSPDPDSIFESAAGDFQASEFSDSAISPRIGLVYDVNEELTIYAQYARGFRAPTAEDINPAFTNPGLYRVIPNPDLQAESSNSFEVGVRGDYSAVDFSLSGYYNTYNNFIDTFGRIIPTPGLVVGSFQTVNRGNVRIYGVEGKAEVDLGSGFSILASTSYTVGDDLDSDVPLSSIDPFTLVAGLRYRDPEEIWGVDLIGTYAGRPRLPRTTDLPNPFVPDSYFTLDLIGYYKVSSNVSLNVGVFNLLNQKYWRRGDVRGLAEDNRDLDLFVQPGITVSAGIKFSF